MNAADAIHAGFADTHVPSDKISTLIVALCASDDAGKTIAGFASDAGPSKLAADREQIDEFFSADTMQHVVMLLEGAKGDWPKATLAAIAGHSPTALAAAHRAVRGAPRHARSRRASTHEYRFAFRTITLHDFLEGVRARVVDKDNAPRWQPPHLEDVKESDIEALFAPLGDERMASIGDECR